MHGTCNSVCCLKRFLRLEEGEVSQLLRGAFFVPGSNLSIPHYKAKLWPNTMGVSQFFT